MNGYTFHNTTASDDRQPPSIPSLNQLQINRPLSAASPNPSQLPPLNASFPSSSSTSYLPPLADRSGLSSHQQPQHQSFPQDKSTLSQLGHHQQQFGTLQSQQYNHYTTPYQHNATQQHYPPPAAFAGAENHNNSSSTPTQNYTASHTPQTQPIVESHHQQPNLLPPFNPQPPQQSQQLPQPNTASIPSDRPMPVVGSQGRRGILPSAPGRPSVSATMEGSMRGQMANNAVKQSDGKYACQFCPKTYLHLKHLKRHHLRHTGERPYQCYLCSETFCRSDILKRHFQKCSIRRGNPTGVTHLTHAQAHLRRSSQTPSASSATTMGTSNGMSTPTQPVPPSSYRGHWPNGVQAQAGQDPGSARSSRSSSVVYRPGSSTDDRKFHNTLATGPQTGNTSLNPSPSSSGGEDRKYNPTHFNMSRDLPPAPTFSDTHHHHQPQSQHFNGYYGGSAPQQYAQTSQPESFPPFNYAQSNGYSHYAPHHNHERFNDQQWGYNHYFQPGADNPMVGYQQH